MNVLIACEESQRVCTEFRKLGHRAFSCDLLKPSGNHPEWHISGDVLPLLNGNCTFKTLDGKRYETTGKWDLIIAHPPCTYLTNGGAVRMFRKVIKEYPPYGTFQMVNVERLKQGILARDFFMKFYNADCDRIAIENPMPMNIYIYICCLKKAKLYSLICLEIHILKRHIYGLKDFLHCILQTWWMTTIHLSMEVVEDWKDQIIKDRNLLKEAQEEAKHLMVLPKQWLNNGDEMGMKWR